MQTYCGVWNLDFFNDQLTECSSLQEVLGILREVDVLFQWMLDHGVELDPDADFGLNAINLVTQNHLAASCLGWDGNEEDHVVGFEGGPMAVRSHYQVQVS